VNLASPAVRTRPLCACYAATTVVHLVSVGLGTVLPFHVVDLGGSTAQVGLGFSVMTAVSMVLRPSVGGWIDRVGARPIVLPGLAVLVAVSLALQLPTEPAGVIAVMAGAGLAYALVNMTTAVITARAAGVEHRGEALALYYLGSSLAIAAAPPAALALRGSAGMPVTFVTVTVLTLVLVAIVLSWPSALVAPVPGAARGFRVWSRGALGVSAPLVLTTVGHSSIYAFLPLYVTSRGETAMIGWFFGIYSVWMIVCRATLGRLSDRIGRPRVALPAMALTSLGYLLLTIPPTPAGLVAAAVVLGTAGSVLYPTLAALALDRAPESERGLALGTLSAAWDLGVVLGSALVGFVADRVSFGAGFGVAAAAAAGGAAMFVIVERRRDVLESSTLGLCGLSLCGFSV
jgi:MFS family permease